MSSQTIVGGRGKIKLVLYVQGVHERTVPDSWIRGVQRLDHLGELLHALHQISGRKKELGKKETSPCPCPPVLSILSQTGFIGGAKATGHYYHRRMEGKNRDVFLLLSLLLSLL